MKWTRLSVSWETLNEQIQHPDKSFKCWEEEREKNILSSELQIALMKTPLV